MKNDKSEKVIWGNFGPRFITSINTGIVDCVDDRVLTVNYSLTFSPVYIFSLPFFLS